MGGFESMRHQFMQAAANYSYRDVWNIQQQNLWLPSRMILSTYFRAADSSDYPWPGMVFGLTILALNAWCTDQVCPNRQYFAWMHPYSRFNDIQEL